MNRGRSAVYLSKWGKCVYGQKHCGQYLYTHNPHTFFLLLRAGCFAGTLLFLENQPGYYSRKEEAETVEIVGEREIKNLAWSMWPNF